MNKKSIIPVSVIIPMRNSETTILKTLNSLHKQTYPIRQICIVDNVSSDESVNIVKKYKELHKTVPIQILVNNKNIGVGGSYNLGVNKASSSLIVLMHSDSTLQTARELEKLVNPFYKDEEVVATYSSIILPRRVWNTYNFWQKVLSCRAVEKKQPGLNGKFDCISKKVYQEIGGFNVKEYGPHINIGAEDADLHIRLLKKGKVIRAESQVVHLHYLGKNYTVRDLFENRKLLARSYGRLLRIEHMKLGVQVLLFFIKPTLVFFILLPFLFPVNIILIFLYVFWYYSEMYLSESSKDIRILMLPVITVVLLLCEVIWMLQSFLFLKRSKV